MLTRRRQAMKRINYLLWLSLISLPAYAGMPVVTLSDVARLRFTSISFFVALLLLVALGTKYLWNSGYTLLLYMAKFAGIP